MNSEPTRLKPASSNVAGCDGGADFAATIVKGAPQCGVVREGVIAGALTGLMILLFIGSWRCTVIIAVSIPLSILTPSLS
jgi:hypothetical protein